MENSNEVNVGFSLSSIGFVVWLVFLILKLCNQNNPDYAWLTWFWVWFPFWLPIAIDLVFGSVILIVYKIRLDRIEKR